MNVFRRFISVVPPWAFILVLIVISVNSVYIYYRSQLPRGGEKLKYENSYVIFDYIKPGSPVDKAGIRIGDTLVSMNSMPVAEWEAGSYSPGVGDTVVSGILRNSREVRMPVIIGSVLSNSRWFYWPVFVIMILLSISSLYILIKKPKDRAAMMFFIYLQQMTVIMNAGNLMNPAQLALVATITFQFSSCLLGPVLIHFHFLFPRQVKFYRSVKRLPILLYTSGLVMFMVYTASYIFYIKTGYRQDSIFFEIEKIALWWLTMCFFLALVIVILNYMTLKDTLSRNQLRMVIIGSFFGFITPMSFALFYNRIIQMTFTNPNPIEISQAIGSMIMICCILIAIFRYRIWNIEVFIRKALLYIGATAVIILSYLILLYLVDLLTFSKTNITRFIILAISVIIFLMLRDRMQRLIDRIFHRETYDSATVVSDFEEKLAGIYHSDELKSGIVRGLDEIFHFKTFVFSLKLNEMMYETAFVLGTDNQKIDPKFEISREFGNMLLKAKVFSPGELDKNLPVIEAVSGELVIPLHKEDQPYGFFLCGPKMSEKTYSLQDIRVLSLIAKRVIALFQTAALYQKDLDRQLMLERERARISQDMHDDVGASLTRISMMSDLVKKRADVGEGARQWLGQISGTSQGLMEEMNQIIWALNPKNDNLEGLVAYIRRFAFEYLEPTKIGCVFDLPEELPETALSVEVRRNVYLVAREALHNVVKHSDATKVWINLELNEYAFMIRIKDNGKGFDSANLEFPGNGLVNMKKRMNDIGGEIVFKSEVGRGSEILIDVTI